MKTVWVTIITKEGKSKPDARIVIDPNDPPPTIVWGAEPCNLKGQSKEGKFIYQEIY